MSTSTSPGCPKPSSGWKMWFCYLTWGVRHWRRVSPWECVLPRTWNGFSRASSRVTAWLDREFFPVAPLDDWVEDGVPPGELHERTDFTPVRAACPGGQLSRPDPRPFH